MKRAYLFFFIVFLNACSTTSVLNLNADTYQVEASYAVAFWEDGKAITRNLVLKLASRHCQKVNKVLVDDIGEDIRFIFDWPYVISVLTFKCSATAVPNLVDDKSVNVDLLNPAEILAPSARQILNSEPVVIRVIFHKEARISTFRADLNGHEITDIFKPSEMGLSAIVSSTNGLISSQGGESSKLNLLRTEVNSLGHMDIDTVIFCVQLPNANNKPPIDSSGIDCALGDSTDDNPPQ